MLRATGHRDDAKVTPPALEIREKLARDNPTVTDYQRSLADSHINIGVLLDAMGRRDDALKSHRRAIEIGEPLGATTRLSLTTRASWPSATTTSALL